MAGDRQFASGIRLVLAGKTTAGDKQINAVINGKDSALGQANADIAHADGLLGIDRALPNQG